MPLTNGVGEHIESRISADGKRVVTTCSTFVNPWWPFLPALGLLRVDGADRWTHWRPLSIGGLSERADRVQFLAVRPSQSVAC